MLPTNPSTESSTNATQIVIEYDEVNSGSGKLVKKLSKSWRIVQESKSFKGSKKFAKAISLEEHLPEYQSSIN